MTPIPMLIMNRDQTLSLGRSDRWPPVIRTPSETHRHALAQPEWVVPVWLCRREHALTSRDDRCGNVPCRAKSAPIGVRARCTKREAGPHEHTEGCVDRERLPTLRWARAVQCALSTFIRSLPPSGLGRDGGHMASTRTPWRVWLLDGAVVGLFGLVGHGVGAQANDGEEQPRTAEEPAEPTAPTRPSRSGAPRVDAKADQMLREMSEYLSNLNAFQILTEHTTEVILPDKQKLEFGGTSQVSVLRPNHLRSDRQGEIVDQTLFYDGETLTLYGRRAGLYASVDAPATLDATIDFARDELRLEAPAADLLLSNSYEALMSDVVSGRVIGQSMVDGVLCNHLAFKGNEVDFQLWIEEGPRPLPRKYVITSKRLDGAPEFTVELKDWDISPLLTSAMFEFDPPPGVNRIEFVREAPRETRAR